MDLEAPLTKLKQFVQQVARLDPFYYLLLIILSISVYAISWNNNFISDDLAGIVENPHISDIGYQLQTKAILTVVYSILYNIFGPNQIPFHMLSTFIHVINVLLLYWTAFLLSRRKSVARMTSILFAVHPLLVESVVWISALSYEVYTGILLLTLIVFILQDRKILTRKYLVLSAILFFFALLASEKAVIFPLVLLMYMALYSKLNKKSLLQLAPFFIVGFFYGIYLLFKVSYRVNNIFINVGQTAPIMNPLKYVPVSIFNYIQLLIAPVNLRFYHEPLIVGMIQYIIAVVLTVVVFVAPFLLYKKSKSAAFGLFLFYVSFIPTWYPVQIAWIVAERYAYLGALGFILFVTSLLDLWVIQKIKKQEILIYSLVVVVLVFSALTIRRANQWQSEDTMWPATVRSSPYSAFAQNNIGDYYVRHQQYNEAIQAFESARRLRKNYAEATNNLANVYMTVREATKAAQLYEEALSYNPNLYHPHMGLGQIYLIFGQVDLAEQHIKKAIQLNPTAFSEYIILIKSSLYKGDKEKALEYLGIMQSLTNNLPDREKTVQNLQSEINKIQ
jgi:tetratricopeptide (TPR) repeat protein